MKKSSSLAQALLPAILLALSVVQLDAPPAKASPQKSGAGRRAIELKPSASPTPVKGQGAAVGGGRGAQPRAQESAPMRLVVQQGLRFIGGGFVVFSSDGRHFATGGGSGPTGGDVVVWDVATGREVRRLTENYGDPGAQDSDGWLWGAFSPDSRLFASSVGPNLRLWDLATGELLWRGENAANAFFEIDGERPPVTFAAGGRQIIVNGTDERLTWDVRTGRLLSRAKLGRPGKRLESFDMRPPRSAASHGGRFVAKASDGVVTVTDKTGGKELGRVRFLLMKEGRTTSSPGQVWRDDLLALAVSPDGGLLVTADNAMEHGGDPHTIRLWDVRTGALLRDLKGTNPESHQFRFTAPGGLVGVTSNGAVVRVREMLSGREAVWTAGDGQHIVMKVVVSQDGRLVATVAGLLGQVWDAQTGQELARVEASAEAGEKEWEKLWDFVAFTPEDTVTFYKSYEGGEPSVVTLGTRDWKERKPKVVGDLPLADFNERPFVMTPDARAAAWEIVEEAAEGVPQVQKLRVWRAGEAEHYRTFKIDSDEAYADASYVLLSPDGRRALVATANNGGNLPQTSVKVWDVETGRALYKLRSPGFRTYTHAWSPDGRIIATGTGDGPGERATLWDAATGRMIRRLGTQVEVEQFSPDGRRLLAYGPDGFQIIYDVATGEELCRFMNRADGSWVVVDPQGRFDTNDLDHVEGVHWVAPDDPLRPLPLEIFMRDYYEPRLLSRILAGEKLPPVRSLARLDRAQPSVGITSVVQQKGRPELVDVTVEVSKGSGGPGRGAEVPGGASGVYDLRLFRDGQLVGYSPAGGGEVRLDARTGRASVTFEDVRLPRGEGAGEVEFSAYAFNVDRVKSATARERFSPPSAPPRARGRAYVISVGVNAYENPAWDLRFAANDARRLQEVVAERIERGGEYEEIVRVPLISDYAREGGRKAEPRVLGEMSATKSNFRAALDLLAGKEVGEETLKRVPALAGLRRATPEDLVLISFSSHGYADERGNFFLLASDTGASGEMRDALGRAISSDELSAWLRDVDAGELVLVVDACHSAASVQGEGFKPGPMGSRGLGQLSYDKGMRILTSTQADNVALESGLIEQGLLTYALTRDGVESNRADFRPRDRRITVGEWLAYGVERVPALHAEVERRLAETSAGRAGGAAGRLAEDSQAKVVFHPSAQTPAGAKGLRVSGQVTRTQQPALFDFARRRRETVLARTE